jgi:hypothetical protein
MVSNITVRQDKAIQTCFVSLQSGNLKIIIINYEQYSSGLQVSSYFFAGSRRMALFLVQHGRSLSQDIDPEQGLSGVLSWTITGKKDN